MALASVGVRKVNVLRRVKISICATGSELIHYASLNCPLGRIRDSNSSYMIKALEDMGAEVVHKSPVVDGPGLAPRDAI